MSTRDKILLESLNLFSEHGYEGVSMRDIAAAVDIKAASIYSHFKGKEAIFAAILEQMNIRYDERIHSLSLNGSDPTVDAKVYANIKQEDLLTTGRALFQYFVHDEYVAKCRKMLTMEQYRNPQLAAVYTKLYYDDPIEYQSVLFSLLIDRKKYPDLEPKVMALHFYAPIYKLMLLCDRDPARENEAMEMLESHIRQISIIYASIFSS